MQKNTITILLFVGIIIAAIGGVFSIELFEVLGLILVVISVTAFFIGPKEEE